jgi:DNA-binding NarL/FixJ family response regulator
MALKGSEPMSLQSLDLDDSTASPRHRRAGTNGGPAIRVMVCDPQPLVRAGLRAILGRHPELTMAGEACDGDQAVAAALELRPTVVIMDHRMPGLDGIEATRRLAGPGVEHPISVLLLVTEVVQEELIAALQAGARGLLRKDESPRTLVHAVHMVASGGVLLATIPSVTASLLGRLLRNSLTTIKPPPMLAALTTRELEVLRLVARGYSNQVIAETLSLCEATVKSHLYHLNRKLDLQDRTQAAVLAYETGLIQPACGGALAG